MELDSTDVWSLLGLTNLGACFWKCFLILKFRFWGLWFFGTFFIFSGVSFLTEDFLECSAKFRSDLNCSSGSENSEPKFSESLVKLGGDSGQESSTFENLLWCRHFAWAWLFDGPVSAVV
jgi:hypothetical protein